ncbi:hypothetical protein HPP92_011576 [Vanilla planifolia]|uniref:Exonuclease domain-containing protein n=1 Tax=Vanilla planifolia TaxID=51239 RepID=A0A835RCM4_VANPL|nr:hypothetical protein HPP92_011576 [Vanilla planifolia]
MSFAPIWSGNFHQMRSSVGSICCLRFFRCHFILFPGKDFIPRMCFLRPLSAKVEGSSQASNSSENLSVHEKNVETLANISNERSDFLEYKSVQHCNIQKNSEYNLPDRPATVLVFDTETTGLSRESGRMIEIAIRDLLGGKNSTFQSLINPRRAVPNAYVHGISSDMVNRPDVPSFEELVPILLQYVSSRQNGGRPVLWIAHNGRRFDVPFLIREFNRCSVEIPEDWVFVDTLSLARQLRNPDGSKLISFSLSSLRERYGIPLVGPAHRAMQDVNVLAYVVQRITYELKLTIPELLQISFRPSDIAKGVNDKHVDSTI